MDRLLLLLAFLSLVEEGRERGKRAEMAGKQAENGRKSAAAEEKEGKSGQGKGHREREKKMRRRGRGMSRLRHYV